MESAFVFDSQVSLCVLVQPDMSMESRLENKCFLCNVKEIEGNSLVDSKESSLILCKIFNVPHLMNDLKKLENINYCHPCRRRILKIHDSLDILKKLEKEVLEEKYLIELQLETNYKVIGNQLHYSPRDFGVELINEMRFKSKLKKSDPNQIDRKFCFNTQHHRIMKNVTITEKLIRETFEGHISKETTPEIYNSTETKPLINDNLSLPCMGHIVYSATNSPFNHAELPLTPHVCDFDEIKFELVSGETNNPADIKDPFEGIVPESGFATEDSATQKTFICGTCETNFDDYNQLDEHCRSHIGSKSFRFCPNELVSKVSLNANSYIDVKKQLKCRYCIEVFPDRFRVKRHEHRHHKRAKSFKCSYCEKSHSRKQDVIKHERIHTGEKPFKCGYCDKMFRNHSNRKSHELIHKEEKPFKCGYCDKTFRDSNYKKIHERIHTRIKSFICNFCEEGFIRKSSMVIHERIHTMENPFKCGYCEKTFGSRGTMKVHENIHKKEIYFKCKFCEKSLSSKQAVIKHERIHTGEKPFKCGYCDNTFRNLSTMKIHEYIHTGNKPFKCKFCEKSFSTNRVVRSHERIHTEENKI